MFGSFLFLPLVYPANKPNPVVSRCKSMIGSGTNEECEDGQAWRVVTHSEVAVIPV